MDFGHDVIKCGATAERIIAIGAAIIPGQVDLITGATAYDQLSLINVMLVH